MKATRLIIVMAVSIALIVDNCQAQFAFGRVFPPWVPHMRAGLPIRNWNGFFAPFAPLAYAANFFGRKKRDTDSNEIKCTISTAKSAIECCLGDQQKIACHVDPNLSKLTPSLHLRLVDLGITEHTNGKHDAVHFRLTSRASPKYTFVDPSSKVPVTISLYSNATARAEPEAPGFIVHDPICFQAIASEIKEIGAENVHINLNIF